MNKLIPPAFALLLLVFANTIWAAESPPTLDFSGRYDCVGDDFKEGKYKGQVFMKRVSEHSTKDYSAYDFELDIPEYGKYPGHAAASQQTMAIYFANTQHQKNHDFGTGIATFSKNSKGKWTFKKFYYEPEYKGGNHGIEICTQQ